jgi:hypothetical protein
MAGKTLEELWASAGWEEADLRLIDTTRRASKKSILDKALLNIQAGLTFAVVITLGYLGLLVYFDQWWIRLGIIGLILYNVVISRGAIIVYTKIKVARVDVPVRTYMEDLLAAMRSRWDFERKTSIFILPVAALFGALVGTEMAGASLSELFEEGVLFQLVFILVITIIGWLSYRALLWMYHHSYGKDTEAVERWLEEIVEAGPAEKDDMAV